MNLLLDCLCRWSLFVVFLFCLRVVVVVVIVVNVTVVIVVWLLFVCCLLIG